MGRMCSFLKLYGVILVSTVHPSSVPGIRVFPRWNLDFKSGIEPARVSLVIIQAGTPMQPGFKPDL